MNRSFREIPPAEISDNVFRAIGRDWMLITAGTVDSYNMMTASWGAWGELWNRPVAFCFVRPQRYTYRFLERASHYTLSFFDQADRAVLDFCGSHSGRDVDKTSANGLTAHSTESGAVYFDRARLVLECRKLYAADIDRRDFIDQKIPIEVYSGGDFHRMYIGEVIRCLSR